tara:strand:+ start:672 stop:1625 length:954 start_codon:yes stop_codon:yes gene_type:complete
MTDTHFEILRPGINTTTQDTGRNHLYHIGITISGAIDQRNYNLANNIVNNKLNEAVIEFAYQGPLLKLKKGKINFAITGNVFFNIIRNNSETEEGKCYQNYTLSDGEQLDIISTKKSVYGYLSVGGGLKLEETWKSYSINTRAQIGPNNGKKYSINERILIKNPNIDKIEDKKINYKDSFNNVVRVIKGTNFDYFSEGAKNIFFNGTFSVTSLVDRMGMRLNGPNLENLVNTNIKSEGLIRGAVQVPADGKPIILLSDHGTIGGYPKIAVVISADLDKVGQLSPGTKMQFKEVKLEEAEKLFVEYKEETKNYLNEHN